MPLIILIGISSFVGGAIATSTIYTLYNRWKERKKMEERLDHLYNSFIDQKQDKVLVN